jgi:uncharacterized cupin superfamily protein
VSLAKANILTVARNWSLDEAGFRHVGTELAPLLGSQRIGASIYEAEAGFPIWPYHYHHGVEEWLYVIAGAPVLRDPSGERALTPGDLVCFPSGHLGAHTMKGRGRFAIFATGYQGQPYMSVYPDSDKVSGPQGILLRSSAVGYWHGEGTGASDPVEVEREPETSSSQAVVNVLALAEAGELGQLLGAERLDATVVDIDPGERAEPYHYTYGREEWLLVLAGTATLRHPEGEDELEAGDVVCFPDGPAGAHRLLNRSQSTARALFLRTTGLPANVCYPETGEWLIRNALGEEVVVHE